MDGKTTLSRSQLGIILAAFALTSVSMGKMMIISGFSGFSAEFPEISLVTKQLLISVASLSGIPVALLMGKMAGYVSKKNLAIAASLLFALGGLVPIFTESFAVMFAARCVTGFGMAMCSTLATSVIAEYFTGSLRSRLIGYNSAVKSLFGIGFSYFGGLLALNSWRSAYWLHGIGFVILLLVLLFLPNERLPGKHDEETVQRANIHITGPVWYYSFAAVMMFVFFSAHGNNISLLFAENRIGSASQAGVASAAFTLGGFLSGLLFHNVYRRLKAATQIVGYVLSGISLLLMGMSGSYPMICMESFVFGLGFYLIIPHQTLLVTEAVSKETYTMAAAIYLGAINLGQVISPFILELLSRAFPGGVSGRYLVAGIGLLAMALIAVLREWLQSKKKRVCSQTH